MKLESYNKAREILARLNILDEEIGGLQRIIAENPTSWIMEIRESRSCSLIGINHFGLLPEFLQAILSKYIAERSKLQKEFDEL